VETLLLAEADQAAERTVTSWRTLPGGPALLALHEGLDGMSPAFPGAAADVVRDWQGTVLDLVRDQGAGKRTQARFLSWGINGAGAAVMIAVFAQTAGLSGAEVAIAGGTTALGQRVMEAVFGDAAVRSLAAQARADLDARTAELLDAEAARFTDLLAEVAPAPDAAAGLRDAVAALAAARRAGA